MSGQQNSNLDCKDLTYQFPPKTRYFRLSVKNYEKDVADDLMFCLMIVSNFMWHGFTVIVRAFAIALMLTIYPDHTSYVLLGKLYK